MTKMCYGGKTRRRNRRSMRGGAATWGEFFENGLNSAKTGVTSSYNYVTGKKSPVECPTCPPCEQKMNYSPGQNLNPSLNQPAGGRRRKRKGGFHAYYSSATLNNMSPYPSAVGGTKKRKGGNRRGTGGSNPMPYYPADTWTNMYPYPAAVGGKKRRTRRRR